MVNIKEFSFGFKNKFVQAKCGISDQVISANKRDGGMKVRAPGPGLKLQASGHKHQASSTKRQAFEPTRSIAKRQASQPE